MEWILFVPWSELFGTLARRNKCSTFNERGIQIYDGWYRVSQRTGVESQDLCSRGKGHCRGKPRPELVASGSARALGRRGVWRASLRRCSKGLCQILHGCVEVT